MPADIVDGTTVRAHAVGWDGSLTDGTEWALDRSDLPLLTVQIGTLVIAHVADDDVSYDQFTVNGIPVDPATIEPITLGALVASACPNCGLPRLDGDEALVASAVDKVPRDPSGKWCKGSQCQTGAGPSLDGSPGAGPALAANGKPVDWETWGPGKKAAWTKKQNAANAKAKADEEELAAAIQVAGADNKIDDALATGTPTDADVFDTASPEQVQLYLEQNGKPNIDPADRVATAKAMNAKHHEDAALLTNQLGYPPLGARDSRRAVSRELGERRPTGGPNTTGKHVFYDDAAIDQMPRAKLIAAATHHSGGGLKEEDLSGTSDASLRAMVKEQNKSYRANVAELQAAGFDDSQIPHGHNSTQRVLAGTSPGFANKQSGTIGPSVAPHGPNVVKQGLVPVPKATPVAHPPGWETWGPGKKAAWTKKQNLLNGGVTKSDDIVKPADWHSWSPGKKAAWTKKHNAGLVATYGSSGGPGQLGEHKIVNGGTKDFLAIVEANPKNQGYGEHLSRYSSFRSSVMSGDPAAHSAWSGYIASDYRPMNRHLRYGDGGPSTAKKVEDMKRAFKYGTPAPPFLERGKAQSLSWSEHSMKVGDVFEDKGFGSWTVSRQKARAFGGIGNKGTAAKSSASTNRTFMRVRTHGVNSIPGTDYERETIMPPGTRYRVLAITDVVGGNGQKQRYMELEVVVDGTT